MRTTVWRAGGKGLAALTLLLDAAKGTAAECPAPNLDLTRHCLEAAPFSDISIQCGSAFAAAKGVATYAGVLLGL